ncbi:MAG TPA: hypothetical protein VFA45_03390 [Actinomycetes bacterium]|nr:hypothetical protein [Actinomycetes bacterium]
MSTTTPTTVPTTATTKTTMATAGTLLGGLSRRAGRGPYLLVNCSREYTVPRLNCAPPTPGTPTWRVIAATLTADSRTDAFSHTTWARNRPTTWSGRS